MVKIGVLSESAPETRVSLTPENVSTFIKDNHEVWVEKDAGLEASHSNHQYESIGAKIADRNSILRDADILLSIGQPTDDDIQTAGSDKIWIGIYQPLYNVEKMKNWAKNSCTIFSLDTLPRTTRAQAMDVLSSQANIAGYKAILLAANEYPRYFPMFMTAAGSIPPAKVLIIGAGVAGLQAIATARRLGAVVEVFDTRPAVKEEVMSLGAKFVDVEGAADASKAGGYAVEQSEEFLQRQKQKIAESAQKADIVITTAQIPGKKAPVLITKEMIAQMKAGSIIIDIAAATGGNTELTKNDETVIENGVKIIGTSRLPSTMPADASKMYSKNIQNFMKLILGKEKGINLNFEDDLVKGCCIAHDSKIVYERIL